MLVYNFRQPVSIDDAPRAHYCEWCGKPAVYQLTAIGGIHHNVEGMFCQECGEAFVRAVFDALHQTMPVDTMLSPNTPL